MTFADDRCTAATRMSRPAAEAAPEAAAAAAVVPQEDKAKMEIMREAANEETLVIVLK